MYKLELDSHYTNRLYPTFNQFRFLSFGFKKLKSVIAMVVKIIVAKKCFVSTELNILIGELNFAFIFVIFRFQAYRSSFL